MKWLPTTISTLAVFLVVGTMRLWVYFLGKVPCEDDRAPRRSPAARPSPPRTPAEVKIPLTVMFFAVSNALVLVGGSVAACALFTWLVGNGAVEGRDVVHAITPGFGWFILPGCIVGVAASFMVVTACMLIELLFSGKARRDLANERDIGLRQMLGCLILIFEVVGVLGEVCMTLGRDSYLLVTPNNVAASRAWSLGETIYDFRDVRSVEVRQVLAGKPARQIPAYTITFADGWQWQSQGWIKDVNPENIKRDRALAAYVAQKAKVPIKKVE